MTMTARSVPWSHSKTAWIRFNNASHCIQDRMELWAKILFGLNLVFFFLRRQNHGKLLGTNARCFGENWSNVFWSIYNVLSTKYMYGFCLNLWLSYCDLFMYIFDICFISCSCYSSQALCMTIWYPTWNLFNNKVGFSTPLGSMSLTNSHVNSQQATFYNRLWFLPSLFLLIW